MTWWWLLIGLTLPQGLSLDTGIPSDKGVVLLGVEAPDTVPLNGTLPLTVYLYTPKPLPATVRVFLHLEAERSTCRLVHDRKPPVPTADGVIVHHVDVPIRGSTCEVGDHLAVYTGLFDVKLGSNYAIADTRYGDDRWLAGHVWLAEPDGSVSASRQHAATHTRVLHTLVNKNPQWALIVGVILALVVLTLLRDHAPWMQRLQRVWPRIYRATHPGRILERLLVWSAIVWGLYVAAQFWSIVWDTAAFPFQLEWMEGGFVQTTDRLINGQSIYGAPSIDHVPYIYPPGYFVVAAIVSWLMGGADFLPLRLVSVITRIIHREGLFAGSPTVKGLQYNDQTVTPQQWRAIQCA